MKKIAKELCTIYAWQPKPEAGIMEVDDRQVTTVQPSFHHRHSTNPVS